MEYNKVIVAVDLMDETDINVIVPELPQRGKVCDIDGKYSSYEDAWDCMFS